MPGFNRVKEREGERKTESERNQLCTEFAHIVEEWRNRKEIFLLT